MTRKSIHTQPHKGTVFSNDGTKMERRMDFRSALIEIKGKSPGLQQKKLNITERTLYQKKLKILDSIEKMKKKNNWEKRNTPFSIFINHYHYSFANRWMYYFFFLKADQSRRIWKQLHSCCGRRQPIWRSITSEDIYKINWGPYLRVTNTLQLTDRQYSQILLLEGVDKTDVTDVPSGTARRWTGCKRRITVTVRMTFQDFETS